ncbi:MAG: beta-glucosidase [Chloroflexi bacterium]|nr:beta-glucosidase [Chloroflexota bacterium]
MLRRWNIVALLVLLLLAACREAAPPVPTPDAPTAPTAESEAPPVYQDASRPIPERVEDLLARMSLAEKIGQMTLIEKNSLGEGDVAEYYLGGVLSGGGGSPRDNAPEGWLEMVRAFQEEALTTPLAIPIIYGVDAVHGHNNVPGAVIFPHNVGLGATRNADLVSQIARVTAVEVAATGIFWNYAPTVAVPQDIRWGRIYEGFAEQTDLVSELGAAYVAGLQGDDLTAETAVLATPKHFVGDGGTTWGSSTTYQIDQGVTEVDEETLRAIHLPPYQAAIDAGARSIMISFSSWGGQKMHANGYLINDVLKGELGFTGFVVSDWGGVDQVDSNYDEAVIASINAGIDMNMVPYDAERFINSLTAAVESGAVSQERIDDAVRRILTVKFELGLFERGLPDESLLDQVGSDEHRALARDAVRQSLVLLQNEDGALPLDKEAPVIFVAGEAADDIGMQLGGWSISWQGMPGDTTEGTTILEAIEEVAAGEVHFNRFGRYERIVDDAGNPIVADVGIIVLAERPYAEGEGDRADLALSQPEIDLVARVRDQSEKVVVILMSGRPLLIESVLANSDAFVAAWLPGTEAQGIADALFGDYEFTGRLPYTWPRTMEQVTVDKSALSDSGCEAPLFPYGYGLTTAEDGHVELLTCP